MITVSHAACRALILATLAESKTGLPFPEICAIVKNAMGPDAHRDFVTSVIHRLESDSLLESERFATGALLRYCLVDRARQVRVALLSQVAAAPDLPTEACTWLSPLSHFATNQHETA